MIGASINEPSCFPFLNALEGRARWLTLAGLPFVGCRTDDDPMAGYCVRPPGISQSLRRG
jgi:hypothetical protein